MKGEKYLSELVDVSMLSKDKLNIIKAPTGSGKTYFALTYIPSLAHDAYHTVVYLIDTINGKEQIVNNYNALPECYYWAKDVDDGGLYFEEDNRIVVMTYAKFGFLAQKYADFHSNFDYIICDELHSLFHFMNIPPKPNYHTVALMAIRSAIKNDKTTVIALTATPKIVKEKIIVPFFELPIDQDVLIHYGQDQIIPYNNLTLTLSSLDPADIGLLYTVHITKMIDIEKRAREMGLTPVCIWSTKNDKYPLSKEQLAVRESILTQYTLPEPYNLLIINSSCETSIKIKSHIDYVIVDCSSADTQVQVRGRVNSDINRIYLLSEKLEPVVVPDEFLGVELYTKDKARLCDCLNVKNKYNRQYKWQTVKKLIEDSGYCVQESRKGNLHYAIITEASI